MSKKALMVLATASLAASFFVVLSCGETNPATAPAGAQVTFVGVGSEGEATYTYAAMNDLQIPYSCFNRFREIMIQYCITKEVGDGKPEATATEECNAFWLDMVDEARPNSTGDTPTTWGDVARQQLAEPGACGYYEVIMTALAFIGSENSLNGQSTSATESGASPLNDVEIRWIVTPVDAEMYELADVPGDIAPLANPYLTRSDDRGISEIKVRIPLPFAASQSVDYFISADIGVDKVTYKVTMAASDLTTTDTTGTGTQ